MHHFRSHFLSQHLSQLATSGLSAVLLLGVTACTGTARAKLRIVHKDPGKPGVVALIAGEEITQEALVGTDKMDFFELEKREYELKMQRIQKLTQEKLIGPLAKKANLPLDEFIEKKVLGGEIKITDSELEKFIVEKGIDKKQINPSVKERILAYLKGTKQGEKVEAFVAKLTQDQPVVVFFKRPQMNIAVDVGSAPFFGPADAPVTIIEFSDFQCPYCSRGATAVHELKEKYGKKVKIAFKQFPLPMHQDAKLAAEASLCMNEQSAEKFWKFHDIAFKNQNKLDRESLESYAKQAGGALEPFKTCLESKRFAATVQKDIDEGEKVGVKSTPTFFVNGQLINGALPIEAFSEIIDEELEQKKSQ